MRKQTGLLATNYRGTEDGGHSNITTRAKALKLATNYGTMQPTLRTTCSSLT